METTTWTLAKLSSTSISTMTTSLPTTAGKLENLPAGNYRIAIKLPENDDEDGDNTLHCGVRLPEYRRSMEQTRVTNDPGHRPGHDPRCLPPRLRRRFRPCSRIKLRFGNRYSEQCTFRIATADKPDPAITTYPTCHGDCWGRTLLRLISSTFFNNTGGSLNDGDYPSSELVEIPGIRNTDSVLPARR